MAGLLIGRVEDISETYTTGDKTPNLWYFRIYCWLYEIDTVHSVYDPLLPQGNAGKYLKHLAKRTGKPKHRQTPRKKPEIQTGASDFKADLDKKLESRRMCTIDRIGVDNDDDRALYRVKCIVPHRAREDDSLVMLANCRLPVVLRKVGEYWQLIGEAYISNRMHGFLGDRIEMRLVELHDYAIC